MVLDHTKKGQNSSSFLSTLQKEQCRHFTQLMFNREQYRGRGGLCACSHAHVFIKVSKQHICRFISPQKHLITVSNKNKLKTCQNRKKHPQPNDSPTQNWEKNSCSGFGFLHFQNCSQLTKVQTQHLQINKSTMFCLVSSPHVF